MFRDLAIIVFEDGFYLPGKVYGATGRALGEAVFATGMTGYQETLTDPSYYGQIVIQTAPHIGNTGVNQTDNESKRIWVAGYAVREGSRITSNWRSEGALEDALKEQSIVGICEVDTRALTRHLREKGALKAGIFSGDALPAGAENLTEAALANLVSIVCEQPAMAGAALAGAVTTKEAYVVAPTGEYEGKTPVAKVAALDLGIKSSTPEQMAARGIEVHVLPQSATLADILEIEPDGVFFSNGPGDPSTSEHEVELLRAVLDRKIPFFGICFGNQILGRALGYGTYKLTYGHRGVNQPVLDRATGRVEITAHNHGFAVDAPVDEVSVAPYDDGRYGRVEVSHLGLNDGVVEGLKALDIPAFSVQYHPEAAAGPHDAEHLFDRFLTMIEDNKESK